MPTANQFVKNLQRFRLVTFDVTDTLLRFRKAPAVQYAKTAAALGITNINQERLHHCFRQEFKQMTQKHKNFGCYTPYMTWQDWWIQLVANIFRCVDPKITHDQLQLLAVTLLRLYRTRECWTHIEGAIELVDRVRAAGKHVGVISNFDPSLATVLNEMDLLQNFDFVLTSYEAGVQKPDSRIFDMARQRCQVQAQEALHIGNLYDIDYVGARNSGWSSLLIMKDSKTVLAYVPETHAHATIETMIKALETSVIQW